MSTTGSADRCGDTAEFGVNEIIFPEF
jgi:hypothetical protein